MRPGPDWRFERTAWDLGYEAVAGLDEAGRGSLAGPVAAAAVILDPSRPIAGIDDSKKLTPRRREELYREIVASARAWSVALVDAREIDRINILQATIRALTEATLRLGAGADFLLIDAVPLPGAGKPFQAIIGGDGKSFSIAAASILAKVSRDRLMRRADRIYPGYGFERHKGYGTPEHLEAIARLGPTPLHRRSFRGVLPPPQSTPPARRDRTRIEN